MSGSDSDSPSDDGCFGEKKIKNTELEKMVAEAEGMSWEAREKMGFVRDLSIIRPRLLKYKTEPAFLKKVSGILTCSTIFLSYPFIKSPFMQNQSIHICDGYYCQ
jgi:hypothetical protein